MSDDAGAGAPDPNSNDDAGSGGDTDDKSFTQADVDRIVRERLARAKSTPPDDYDDLKAKAAKLDELEESNRSELEKAQARAEAAEKAAAAAAERVRQTNLRSAVISAASTAGAVDPDAGFKIIDQDAVTVGDDGQVTGAEEAVKALLESKPYLVGQAAPPPKTGSADGGRRGESDDGKRQLTRDDIPNMTPDEIVKAEEEGRFADLYAGKT